jgi:acid phosphatase family membrane protein YuiD
MEHNCQFQEEIMSLVKEAGTQTALLSSINKNIEDLNKRLENQQTEITELKTFKSNAVAIGTAIGIVCTAAGALIVGIFNGAYQLFVHKGV